MPYLLTWDCESSPRIMVNNLIKCWHWLYENAYFCPIIDVKWRIFVEHDFERKNFETRNFLQNIAHPSNHHLKLHDKKNQMLVFRFFWRSCFLEVESTLIRQFLEMRCRSWLVWKRYRSVMQWSGVFTVLKEKLAQWTWKKVKKFSYHTFPKKIIK